MLSRLRRNDETFAAVTLAWMISDVFEFRIAALSHQLKKLRQDAVNFSIVDVPKIPYKRRKYSVVTAHSEDTPSLQYLSSNGQICIWQKESENVRRTIDIGNR